MMKRPGQELGPGREKVTKEVLSSNIVLWDDCASAPGRGKSNIKQAM